jgi:ABC-type antimicrobial peptide transport system permease subunit
LVQDQIGALRLPLKIESSSTLSDEIGFSYQTDTIRMQATSLFGAIALLLIMAGIYGLMAYSVSQRSREIGVRVAIGATSGRVVHLVLRDSLKLIGAGLLPGIPAALAAMKALEGLAFGLAEYDIPSLIAAAVVLLLMGLAAAGIPAWRATRVDPVEALRVQ